MEMLHFFHFCHQRHYLPEPVVWFLLNGTRLVQLNDPLNVTLYRFSNMLATHNWWQHHIHFGYSIQSYRLNMKKKTKNSCINNFYQADTYTWTLGMCTWDNGGELKFLREMDGLVGRCLVKLFSWNRKDREQCKVYTVGWKKRLCLQCQNPLVAICFYLEYAFKVSLSTLPASCQGMSSDSEDVLCCLFQTNWERHLIVYVAVKSLTSNNCVFSSVMHQGQQTKSLKVFTDRHSQNVSMFSLYCHVKK